VPKPVGLFGHSQGGWVLVEAAGRSPEAAFVVTSSGPGVTPAEQERYPHRTYLADGDVETRTLSVEGRAGQPSCVRYPRSG
jgi:pimeloyl-ACP methyl ester carboxylesterase